MRIDLRRYTLTTVTIRRKDKADVTFDISDATRVEANDGKLQAYIGLDHDPFLTVEFDESVQSINFY